MQKITEYWRDDPGSGRTFCEYFHDPEKDAVIRVVNGEAEMAYRMDFLRQQTIRAGMHAATVDLIRFAQKQPTDNSPFRTTRADGNIN